MVGFVVPEAILFAEGQAAEIAFEAKPGVAGAVESVRVAFFFGQGMVEAEGVDGGKSGGEFFAAAYADVGDMGMQVGVGFFAAV